MESTRILLAEDNPDHQLLLRHALRRGVDGADVVAVGTHTAAVSAARDAVDSGRPFACIVLDYNLPPHTAPETITAIKEVHPDAPIVVVSSSEEQRVVIESLRLGVADFIRKEAAMNSEELGQRIREVVARARSHFRDRRNTDRRMRVLKKQAETDPLTGLRNRRSVMRILASDRTRNDRRRDTAVLMVDIDHFKSINDTHGHCVGDLVLKRLAATIGSQIARSDIAARWGGEEFLVLKPSIREAEAVGFAERLRVAVEEDLIPIGDEELRVTVSVGVAVVRTADLNESAVARADHALYLSKELGRNRVCTWEMARAVDAADDIETIPGLCCRQRLSLLRDRIRPLLGEMQATHSGPHGVDVRAICTTIGNSVGLPASVQSDIDIAAEFHDIGKIAVPEEILCLPRTLTLEERRLVDAHAAFGATLARRAGVRAGVTDLIAAHHSRFDDRTRPVGNADHRAVGVLVAADALSAMNEDRPYRPRLSSSEIVDELDKGAGSQFDPVVVVAARRSVGTVLRAA